jgi:hypothetical protein
MLLDLLKLTESWLKDRKAYVVFGEKTSKVFNINIGLPQGSSLSPYLFIVFHCDRYPYFSSPTFRPVNFCSIQLVLITFRPLTFRPNYILSKLWILILL